MCSFEPILENSNKTAGTGTLTSAMKTIYETLPKHGPSRSWGSFEKVSILKNIFYRK